jgi:hypothetical protein
MSDEQPARRMPEQPREEFPTEEFPVVFVDRMWSLVNSSHIAKMYFTRIDPAFAGTGRTRANPVIQLVMPVDSVADMLAFLEVQVRSIIESGALTEERLAQARAVFTP